MPLPLKVDNALRLGQNLAAIVTTTRPDWHGWVWVNPVMKIGKTYAQYVSECTLKGVASGFYDETIVRFQVRYVELSDWHLADSWFFDLDVAIEQRPIIDESYEAKDRIELVQLLSRWITDLNALKPAFAVRYPYPPQ